MAESRALVLALVFADNFEHCPWLQQPSRLLILGKVTEPTDRIEAGLMRMTTGFYKQNTLRKLLMCCLLLLIGFSMFMLAGPFDSMNFHHLSIRGAGQTKPIKVGEPFSKKYTGIFTAYTSRVQETDNRPYITADKTNLKEHPTCVVANNKLKFGTKIRIDGIGICEVRDRIGRSRGRHHFDIYMGDDVAGAKQFGERKLRYSIIKQSEKQG